MIILILILATFTFAGAMIFGRTGVRRTLTIGISFVLIAGSLIALVGNDTAHWGMHPVTTTRISDLRPAKSRQAALLIKPLGSGSERTIIYRVAGNQSLTHTVADTTTTTKVMTGSPAQVQLTTTRWQYRNHWSRVLFSLGAGQPAVTARHYLFTVPQSWKTVTITSTK